MQQQKRSGSLPSQRQDDEAQYRRLLAKYADILDNENGTSRQSLISTLLSWLFLRRTISPSSIYTCGQGFFRMAGKLAKPAAKLAKGMPALVCAVLFGFISAVGLTWCWWYVRRNCVWIIYRLLFPLLLNSIIALIPMSLPTIDEASWSMTLPLAFVIAGLSLLARHSFKFAIGRRSPRQIRRAE